MKPYVFKVVFGIGPKVSKTAIFSLELNEDEIAFLQEFLQRNGDCRYEYLELENGYLFDKINDAANQAVLDAINYRRKKKLDFFDIPWETMSFDFIWADELLKE